ncbi:MAG: type IV pilus secretin PilQ [Magnetococcales bacterium]|nr:type IV pilus secretin PilQ [Magnetococcales bacterium]
MRVKRKNSWLALLTIMVLGVPLLIGGCKTTEDERWEGLNSDAEVEQEDQITIGSMAHYRTQKGEQISLVSDKPLTYQVFRLSNPQRVVLIFPKANLAANIQPTVINNSPVTGLFPSEEEMGGSRIEVTLEKALEYEVKERSDGLDIVFIDKNSLKAARQAVLEDVAVHHQQNGTELRLLGKGVVTTPKAFRLDNPPRLVLDMAGVRGPGRGRHVKINSPHAINAFLMGGAEKTRLVVELVDASVGFKINIDAGMPVISLGNNIQPSDASNIGDHANLQEGIRDVQFTRDGALALLRIKHNSVGPLKISREDGQLFLSFAKTPVDQSLIRRMDVRAFGGPVLTIDTTNSSGDTSVVVTLDSVGSRHEVLEKDDEVLVIIHPAPAKIADGASPYTGSSVSLDFKDIEVQNALRIIAEVSKLNIILSDSVSGTITMRLMDVPWDQALDLILEAKGLGKVRQGNVLRVAPLAEIQSTAQARLQARQSAQQLEPFVTELIPVSFAGGAELRTLLMEGDQKLGTRLVSDAGSVSIDTRTNTLIVKDTAENMSKIREMVKKLDKPIPQVLIEARIVEVDRNSANSFGINWGFAAADSGLGVSSSTANAYEAFIAAEGDTNPRARLTTSAPANVNLLPTASTGSLGIHLGGLSPLIDLDIEIAALESDNKAKTISSPRVLTTNNKAANISQGQKVPYTVTQDGVNVTTYVEAKLSLEVTPQATPNNYITLQIKATNDSITDVGPPPLVNTKTINTQALVFDGETIVLGGIYTNNQVRNKSKVPGLHKMPLLGWMFENNADTDTQSELLIFITPHIIHSK